MKFRIQFKDPDGVYDSIDEEATKSISDVVFLDDEEREAMIQGRRESLQKFSSKWVKYGEYILIEFDTETGEASVLPANEQ